MGVDMFWKRTPKEALKDRTPAEIGALVPHWFDDEYETAQAAGTLVGVEDTGELVGALLRYGALGTPDEAAAAAFARLPGDWDDWAMVGTLDPDRVRLVARFLARAPLAQWSRQFRAALAAEARDMGYRRPFDDAWAAQVLADARELAAMFQVAAANNEAVIVKVSA